MPYIHTCTSPHRSFIRVSQCRRNFARGAELEHAILGLLMQQQGISFVSRMQRMIHDVDSNAVRSADRSFKQWLDDEVCVCASCLCVLRECKTHCGHSRYWNVGSHIVRDSERPSRTARVRACVCLRCCGADTMC